MKMTKLFLAFFIGILLFAPLREARPHAVNGDENHNVEIPNAVLRGIIETNLFLMSGDPITADKIAGRTGTAALAEVVKSDQDINDLTGLEHATKLTRVQIGRNRIRFHPRTRTTANTVSDLSPLKNLSMLTHLDFSTHRITDLSPLANLTMLNLLDLTSNWELANIAHLSGLTSLRTLHLDRCNITDTTAIGNLTNLRVLWLGNNPNLRDISPLANLGDLRDLRLNSLPITGEDLSAVLPALEGARRQEQGITYWAHLDITNTEVSDLSVLDRIPDGVLLHTLYLQYMGTSTNGTRFLLLKDLTPLVDLMNNGKVVGSDTLIRLRWNFRLDYPSLYEDLPTLLGMVRGVEYLASTPSLEKESPTDEPYRGHPGTRHTFVVRTINDTPYSNYPLERTQNRTFNGVPVTFTVTNPDGTTETHDPVLTGDDGLARVTITLGNDGETHTVTAVVPENRPTMGPQHEELRVTFTATADITAPPPPGPTPPSSRQPLTVTFADYPEEKPIDEFTLTLRFSEPVIGFEKSDITVDTELDSGDGDATLVDLTPETPVRPDRPDPNPIQSYTATVELPSQARGTVKLIVRKDAATTPATAPEEKIGPASDTASDPIKFGRRIFLVYPSHVAMDKIVFNEFRNATDDKNDWIELKNISNEPVSLLEWEVSLVLPHAISPATPQWEIFAMDREVAAFPDYTLPPGGVLLIVNTDPSENDLIRGQDIANPKHNPDRRPHYLLAPDMILPQHPYLLILRSKRDQNGKPEALEDLFGNYHKYDLNYYTQIWPLRNTLVPTGTAALLTESEVYQRVIVPRFTSLVPTLQPEKRGYLRGAWTPSESASGLGYRPGAPVSTSLGTPGYPNAVSDTETEPGELSISEVMFATDERGTLSQWIELYNPSETEVVNLQGWELVITAANVPIPFRSTRLVLNGLEVLPNQTVLLVTGVGRHSENLPDRRIYDLQAQHPGNRYLKLRANRVLSSEGFGVYLFSPDGTLVDRAGNLTGRRGQEKPRWVLPTGWTEAGARTSLIRRYENRLPAPGTVPSSWVRAADTSLLMGYSYYGLPTDDSTAGYRQGSPLPVTLSGLRADRSETGVVVNWTTQSEMENAGFYVLRSQNSKTGFVRVTPILIAGAGTTAERHTYTYRDTTAKASVAYYYRLEEVSLSGVRRTLATVRLRGHVSAANKLLWKWADVKAED